MVLEKESFPVRGPQWARNVPGEALSSTGRWCSWGALHGPSAQLLPTRPHHLLLLWPCPPPPCPCPQVAQPGELHCAAGSGSPLARPPGCQGNVTNAARALNTCQDAARAGRRRQNFQTIGCAVPCPTRCLPQHHMAAASRTSPEREFPWEKKTRRLRYMSLGPAALCLWLSSDFRLACLAWLRAPREMLSVCSVCARLSSVGARDGSRQVTRCSGRGHSQICFPGRVHPRDTSRGNACLRACWRCR